MLGLLRFVEIWIADPASRYTNQLVATRVIQVPTSEVIWPAKNSR